MQDRLPTVSERVYREYLHAATKKERADFQGQLVAICFAACARRHIAPPYEWKPNPKHEHWRGWWIGGPKYLLSWVRNWVAVELSDKKRLKDCGRYIGRRCVNALIDQIRWYKRRKRGAKERRGRWECGDDFVEELWSRNKVRRAFKRAGLPGKLPITGDVDLFERLVAAYPQRLTNVAIARTLGVSEGAIRKRRKRISQVCFELTDDNYLLNVVFKRLGLKDQTSKRLI